MVPTFPIGGLTLPTHDVFVLAGVLVAVGIFALETRRRKAFDPRLVWVVLGAVISGGLFARLSTGWQYLAGAPDPTVPGLWMEGGRSILGGLAGAYLGAVVTKRLVGYERRTGDLFAPAVAAGMAVGRVGCFLTEQVGTPTSLPWGITVEPATAAAMPFCPSCALGVAMHPSFLYEIAFHLAMLGVLVALRSRYLPEGELFKIYLVAYGSFRFLVEFVRDNRPLLGPFSGSQIFLLVTLPLLIGYFLRRSRLGTYRAVAA
ncbi:MAG TPA: prolipoprotein diacylglyceryl transferase family protein [Acidimicrobiia bacterium]|nr:prolipoprotein diacylglyceryl transferase family protein [Acidimicrobiia bacterium]